MSLNQFRRFLSQTRRIRRIHRATLDRNRQQQVLDLSVRDLCLNRLVVETLTTWMTTGAAQLAVRSEVNVMDRLAVSANARLFLVYDPSLHAAGILH